MKRIIAFILSCWDEFAAHQRRVLRSFLNSVRTWWGGTVARRILDLVFGFLIAHLLLPVALGLAAANFMDGSNTLYAMLSLTVWFMILEVVALWVLEIIVLLASFQVSSITRRIGQHYRRRMEEKNHATTSVGLDTPTQEALT